MAGGLMRYRTLSRDSAHRKALLRNLVTSLFKHESISTTWHKAKEAQRWAEKLITLAKRDTQASRLNAMGKIFEPECIMPILFNDLAKRYAQRPGGYTRVLRVEPEKEDQAPSAILELVDGPKDMRLALTARTIAFGQNKAKEEDREFEVSDMTAHNIMKVTRFRKRGDQDLHDMVERFKELHERGDHGVDEIKKVKVYPKLVRSR